MSLLRKLFILFRFHRGALKLFEEEREQVIPYLQNQFYKVKRQELEQENLV